MLHWTTFFTDTISANSQRKNRAQRVQLPHEITTKVLEHLGEMAPKSAEIARLRRVSRGFCDAVDFAFPDNFARIATGYAIDFLETPARVSLSPRAKDFLARTSSLSLVPREAGRWPWGDAARLAHPVSAKRLDILVASALRCRRIDMQNLEVAPVVRGDDDRPRLLTSTSVELLDLRNLIAPRSTKLTFNLPQIKQLWALESAWLDDVPYRFTTAGYHGMQELSLEVTTEGTFRRHEFEVPPTTTLRSLTLFSRYLAPFILNPPFALRGLAIAQRQRQLLQKLCLQNLRLTHSARITLGAAAWPALTHLEILTAELFNLDDQLFTHLVFPALDTLIVDGNPLGYIVPMGQLSLNRLSQLATFSMKGNRTSLPADRLPLLLAPGNRLRMLDLSGIRFRGGPQVTLWLGQLLQQAPHLEHLSMNEVFPSKADSSEGARVRQLCHQLRPSLCLDAAPRRIRPIPSTYPG